MKLFLFIQEQIIQEAEFLVRIALACFLGICIGFERKNRNKMAGVRTHAVVAFGAALMMIVSKYGFADISNFDASRIAAQIVSGVGFLGAGIIFVRNHSSVSGLTTAAGIWATAGVGMACGAGQYFISISSAVLLVMIHLTLHRVSFLSKEAYRGNIKVVMVRGNSDLQELEGYILEEKIMITAMKVNKANRDNTKFELELLFPPECNKTEFISRLADKKNVLSVRG